MANIYEEDGKKVIEPEKKITAPVDELKKEVQEVIDEVDNNIVFDMQNVEIIDSSGIGLLIAAHNSLKEDGHKLEVINLNDDIHRLFKTMRLDDHFEIK